MSCPDLESLDLAREQVYRIGRSPNPWAWPDWSRVGDDRTFGNRYDDPEGIYRVLYVARERRATFIETLARFRPDPALLAALEAIEGDEPLDPINVVPRSWLSNRLMGEAKVTGNFATMGSTATLTYLRTKLASELVGLGLDDLDASTVRMSIPRSFTQKISRTVYVCTAASRRQFDGIHYLSRLGDSYNNLALFEPPFEGSLQGFRASEILQDDPDFREALRQHGLILEGP